MKDVFVLTVAIDVDPGGTQAERKRRASHELAAQLRMAAAKVNDGLLDTMAKADQSSVRLSALGPGHPDYTDGAVLTRMEI